MSTGGTGPKNYFDQTKFISSYITKPIFDIPQFKQVKFEPIENAFREISGNLNSTISLLNNFSYSTINIASTNSIISRYNSSLTLFLTSISSFVPPFSAFMSTSYFRAVELSKLGPILARQETLFQNLSTMNADLVSSPTISSFFQPSRTSYITAMSNLSTTILGVGPFLKGYFSTLEKISQPLFSLLLLTSSNAERNNMTQVFYISTLFPYSNAFIPPGTSDANARIIQAPLEAYNRSVENSFSTLKGRLSSPTNRITTFAPVIKTIKDTKLVEPQSSVGEIAQRLAGFLFRRGGGAYPRRKTNRRRKPVRRQRSTRRH